MSMHFGKEKLFFMACGATVFEGLKTFLKTKTAHDLAVKVVAERMKLKNEAMATIQDIKDEAQDIVEDAKNEVEK